ncbi:transposase [Streptomyces sp. NPDC002668]|uniref:transposase n=1 Tax=Streptomyces sp. NPDC002668 TaxID=3154422 RepID=UPI00332854A8
MTELGRVVGVVPAQRAPQDGDRVAEQGERSTRRRGRRGTGPGPCRGTRGPRRRCTRWPRAIRRHKLSDAEREFVRPLLPESPRSRKRVDDHRVRTGIVRRFRIGTAWWDVPQRYGSWTTLPTRFHRWATDGTFE